MSKFAKDIKVNDILWTISGGDKPQLLPLIVTNIDIKKMLWTGYYNLTVKLPDGSDKFISLFDTGERRDYNVPLLTDLLSTLKYDHQDINVLADILDKNDSTIYEEYKKSSITIMACFDKDILWKHYVDELESSMKSIEEVIERGKQNLEELNKKLKYIKKQHDSIQEG